MIRKRVSGGAHAAGGRSSRAAILAAAAEYSIRSLLAFMLARSGMANGISPFAAAYVSTVPDGPLLLVALVFAAFGYLSAGSFVWGLKYISASFLTACAIRVFRHTPIAEKAWFRPAAASFMLACTGLAYAWDSGFTLTALLRFACETALCGMMSYFYLAALSPWPADAGDGNDELLRRTSALALAVSVLLSLNSLLLFGTVSVGRALLVLLILTAAQRGGSGAGAVCGLVAGCSADLVLGGGPFFAVCWPIAGMLTGVFSRQTRLTFTLVFVLTNAAATLSVWKQYPGFPALLEAFIASVTFLVIPHRFFSRINVFLPSGVSGYGASRIREYTRRRVEETAAAFSGIYETVRSASGAGLNDDNIATVFDRAAETACRTCPRSMQCWQIEYERTLDVLNNLTPKMSAVGRIEPDDFPDFFSTSCRNLLRLTAAINEELTALAYRRQYRNRLRDNIGAAYNQYSDIASVLHSVAEELGSGIDFEPALEKRLQRYLRSMDLDASVAAFRDRSGRLHAEIESGGVRLIRKDPRYLEKLSAVLQTRLCTPEVPPGPGRLVLLEAEPYSAKVGIASIRRHGESISGDSCVYFKTDEGLLCILLSDGMGTGRAAAECSSGVLRVLERLLRAGVPADISLRILNDLMLLKNNTDIACATVDLFCISLFTGHADIFKFGAAPSYVRSGGSVSRIRGSSLAAGLESAESGGPDRSSAKLTPASIALMVSDGAVSGEDDRWLMDALAAFSGSDPKELAALLARLAREKNGEADDTTVLAVMLEARK